MTSKNQARFIRPTKTDKGLLIVFEGIDGSGKTKQASLLYEKIQSLGIRSVLLREPGGTVLGNDIRAILLSGKAKNNIARLFLFLASRVAIISEAIVPAMARGEVVICDRFVDSTAVYQGDSVEKASGDRKLLSSLNALATGGLEADLTIVIDTDPSVATARSKKDALDTLDVETATGLRKRYIEIASNKERHVIVDGNRDIDAIADDVYRLVESLVFMRPTSIEIDF